MNYSCRQVSQLFSDSLDKKLKTFDYLRLRFHWMMCRACRQSSTDMRMIHTVLKPAKELILPERKRLIILKALQHAKEDTKPTV
ncbi:MAG: hypothetical protein Q9M28_03550 [Mariprofundaceae bacterium]|nr:hypothetical protein [Mariprofundaceae bacterium]